MMDFKKCCPTTGEYVEAKHYYGATCCASNLEIRL
jgi:hypothetical protein